MSNKYDVMISNTHEVAGYEVKKTIGVVYSDVILGANLFKDFFAKVTDLAGGRSSSYEKAIAGGRSNALEEIIKQTSEAGGNAIIGVDFQFTTIGEKGTMLGVFCTATAAVVEKAEERKSGKEPKEQNSSSRNDASQGQSIPSF